MKKAYDIEIKETLSEIIRVEAESQEEAIDKIQNKYYNQEFVLEPDSFQEVEFNCLEEIQESEEDENER